MLDTKKIMLTNDLYIKHSSEKEDSVPNDNDICCILSKNLKKSFGFYILH